MGRRARFIASAALASVLASVPGYVLMCIWRGDHLVLGVAPATALLMASLLSYVLWRWFRPG